MHAPPKVSSHQVKSPEWMLKVPSKVTRASRETPNRPNTRARAMPTGRYSRLATMAPMTAACDSEIIRARTRLAALSLCWEGRPAAPRRPELGAAHFDPEEHDGLRVDA